MTSRQPICGECFCEVCGDCLACYADDPCGGRYTFDGDPCSHTWPDNHDVYVCSPKP